MPMNRRTAAGRGAALFGALALVLTAGLAGAGPAAADGNPDVDVSTLANPTLNDALLNILIERGIDYVPVTDARSAANSGGGESTLVIDDDETLDKADLHLLTSTRFARVILLTDDPQTLAAFVPSADITITQTVAAELAPDCTGANTAATSAGMIDNPGGITTYHDATADQEADLQACYPVDGSPSMLEFPPATAKSPDVVLLGSADFTQDQYLADDGNADLAMRLFGGHRRLVWLAGSFVGDSALECQDARCVGFGGGNGNGGGSNGGGTGNGGTGTTQGNGPNGGKGTTTTISPFPQNVSSPPTLLDMLPTWIWWVLAQIVLAVLLLAYWRARRHGRIVSEPLPVTVHASETVEGHARLYRRAGAYGHSALLLRRAGAGRMAPFLGLPPARAEADPRLLAAPIAARLGVSLDLVEELLAGPAPTSEAELVLLADHLDQLEQEVRTS